MNVETEKRALDSLRDPAVESVLFGGMGEPLLYPRVVELTRALSGMGKQVELLTNGTMLSGACSEQLLGAGLDMLWVSMDGFTPEAYGAIRRGSVFARICENLEQFNRLRAGTGAKLGLTFVVTCENRAELDRMNAFADRFGADLLNVSHVIPGEPLPREDALYKESIPVGRMERIREPYVEHPHDFCPFVQGDQVFLRWDGEVVPCMQLLHTCHTYLYDLRRTVYRHAFGNLAQNTLREIWESREYVQFRQRVKEFYFPNCTECLGCEDREQNLIDCLYNDTPTCGACLWATGKIFCP